VRRIPEEIDVELKEFVHDLRLRGMTWNTIKNSRCAVARYLVWCRSHARDLYDQNTLLSYLEYLRFEKQLLPVSVQKEFGMLGTWLDFLVEQGELDQNPMPRIRKRYLKTYKDSVRHRQIISIEDAAKLVRATIDSRDRAILMLFLKTGIRRNELISLDVQDLNIEKLELILKPTPKRSNRIVFFDEECAAVLQRWLRIRESRYKKPGETALFISYRGSRLKELAVNRLVARAGMRVGLHDPNSDRLEDKFTPHCCRHWFTTHLIRSGMPRDYIKWLRGDAIVEAIDIYNHIDPEDVRRSYLAHIPMLGV
jgi:integrase/recombinase XerD